MSKYNHLIIIAGNSVLKDYTEKLSNDYLEEDDAWILKGSREKDKDFPKDLIRHIKIGTEILLGDEKSLIVLSGGATRSHHHKACKWDVEFKTNRTEAESYELVIQAICPSINKDRILLDNYSYNSAHNVLFSINRFWQYTNELPSQITIVARDFKLERFQIYIEAIEKEINTRFDYSFVGVRDSNIDNSKESWEYELNQQLPKIRKDPMKHFKELNQNRFPGPQDIDKNKICPKLQGLINLCINAATKKERK